MVQTAARIRLLTLATALALFALAPQAAHAATSIDGPIELGTAGAFAVLGGSTVTNTGPSVLDGDLGLSPGRSLTGFPPGIVNGTVHTTDETAAQAQRDLTTAYGVAAGLTPQATGLGDLTGQSLTPGVYSGGELALTGALTLEGTAESVWVFQAASTLTVAPGAIITVTGGASACNVFWQVGSSATIQSGAQFVGTVLAQTSITANTGATVTGRLLAQAGAVTLDTTTITTPSACAAETGTVTRSPEITSAAPAAAQVGTPYSHTITATGSPTPTFAVSSGTLPSGLILDGVTGTIGGEPTASGSFPFTVTASNGTAPDASADYALEVSAAAIDDTVAPAPVGSDAGGADAEGDDAASDETALLAETGTDVGAAPFWAAGLASLGALLLLLARTRRDRAGAGVRS